MYATGGTCTGEQPVRYLSAVTNRHIQLVKTCRICVKFSLQKCLLNDKMRMKSSYRIKRWMLCFVGWTGVILFSLAGCKGVTNNPTEPDAEETPTAQSSPKPTISATPTPSTGSSSCDNYADRPTETNLRTLDLDGNALRVVMECAGDVDWFVIELPEGTVKLKIALTDMSEESDFDLVVYDSSVKELKDGRSSRSGNSDEEVLLTVDDSKLYVQIYAFSKRGEALLTVTVTSNTSSSRTPTPTPTPTGTVKPTPTPEINQLTYEQLLNSKFWHFPRGTNSALLERSVETIQTKAISCRKSGVKDAVLTGEFTIGNYAHVERDLLKSVDYVDGWALVVFNGSAQILDILHLTTRLNISSDNLDMVVNIPTEVNREDSDEFSIESEEEGVYYLAHFYGDLSQSSSKDVRISSGVVGKANDVLFEQRVEVEWEFEGENGYICSGIEDGKKIADFELGNFLAFQK